MNLYRVYSAPYTMSTIVSAEEFSVATIPDYIAFLQYRSDRPVIAAFPKSSVERIMIDRCDGAQKTVWINHAKCTEESGRFFAALEWPTAGHASKPGQ